MLCQHRTSVPSMPILGFTKPELVPRLNRLKKLRKGEGALARCQLQGADTPLAQDLRKEDRCWFQLGISTNRGKQVRDDCPRHLSQPICREIPPEIVARVTARTVPFMQHSNTQAQQMSLTSFVPRHRQHLGCRRKMQQRQCHDCRASRWQTLLQTIFKCRVCTELISRGYEAGLLSSRRISDFNVAQPPSATPRSSELRNKPGLSWRLRRRE